MRSEKETIHTAQLAQQDLQIVLLKDEIAQLTTTVATNQLMADQHSAIKIKLFETLNQNTLLRNELKLAQKCIQREIGSGMTLAALTSAKTTWHGRAEQISILQNKIAELKTQCDGAGGTAETGSVANFDNQLKFTLIRNIYLLYVDAKYLQLRKNYSQSKMELEDISKQFEMAKQDADEQRYKLNAQRVRNTNLQSEISSYKQQLLTLSEKIQDYDLQVRKLNVRFSY